MSPDAGTYRIGSVPAGTFRLLVVLGLLGALKAMLTVPLVRLDAS
jgi:hypothetical protein